MLAPEAKLKFFEDTTKEAATDLGYKDISVDFKNISEFGVNYLGDILKATVSCTKDGSPETLFFVAKAVPDNEMLRRKLHVGEKFNNEAIIYSTILPAFDELQAKYDVQDPLKHCGVFKIVSEKHKEVMLMNDLTSPEFDFEQSRIGTVLDLEHARSVLKNIGKMHALSLATDKHSPGFLETALTPLSEMLEGNHVVVKSGIEASIEVVEDQIAKDKLLKTLPTLVDYITNVLDRNNLPPYAVLSHCDIWSNNVMFKYEGDTLVESVLLDWQIVRYHSPILDLLFFLFTSVDDDVRAANFQSLLDLYYSTLTECLKDLKCDADELFPRMAFEEQLKRFAEFALMYVLFMLPYFTGKPFDPTKIDLAEGDIPELTDLYKRKVNATLRDFINNKLF